jgi:hypothetical protein
MCPAGNDIGIIRIKKYKILKRFDICLPWVELHGLYAKVIIGTPATSKRMARTETPEPATPVPELSID